MTTDWNALAKMAHDNAKAHGWWDDDRPWALARILIVTEISEAMEEFRAGRMALWARAGTTDWLRAGGAARTEDFAEMAAVGMKPEGFPVELSDVALRILDWCGHLGHDIVFAEFNPGTASVPSQLDAITESLYMYEDSEDACEAALAGLCTLAAAHDIDLVAMIHLKHAYNVTRPFRHGGRAA